MAVQDGSDEAREREGASGEQSTPRGAHQEGRGVRRAPARRRRGAEEARGSSRRAALLEAAADGAAPRAREEPRGRQGEAQRRHHRQLRLQQSPRRGHQGAHGTLRGAQSRRRRRPERGGRAGGRRRLAADDRAAALQRRLVESEAEMARMQAEVDAAKGAVAARDGEIRRLNGLLDNAVDADALALKEIAENKDSLIASLSQQAEDLTRRIIELEKAPSSTAPVPAVAGERPVGPAAAGAGASTAAAEAEFVPSTAALRRDWRRRRRGRRRRRHLRGARRGQRPSRRAEARARGRRVGSRRRRGDPSRA